MTEETIGRNLDAMTKVSKPMHLNRRKKIILISLIIFIGVIILLSIIYHQTALWEPEQHLITLLPKSPICYLTLKELKGLVETFNRSEFGKQTAKMPLLAEIKEQRWWKQFVYQKQLWEYEMGGRLDLKTVTGYFGEEAILAFYQREGEITFLLITAVGAQEKLSIEALTATDAINPNYERIQTEYRDLTINTIVGYPRDFSYTFIGKIGILSLDPLLLAETIDLYANASDAKASQNGGGFIAEHPMSDEIQQDYRQGSSTLYVDMPQLVPALDKVGTHALVKQFFDLFGDAKYWAFSNQYEDGVIISRHRLLKSTEARQQVFPSADDAKPFLAFPERTAFAALLPVSNQMSEIFGDIDFSQVLDENLTLLLVAPEPDEVSVMPSLVLIAHAKAPDPLKTVLEVIKQGKISFGGKPLEFLKPQNYKNVTVQPVQFRLNFLLAVTGGYAIVNDYFVFSTTLAGLKPVIDTTTGNAPVLADVPFSADTSGLQTFMQPHLFVPELKRILPIANVPLSLSGQQLDATLTQRITENLFPLESLGPISAEMDFSGDGVNTEIRIVLEE
ncbi:MAG: hypothetical protein OXU36_02635 [Candidatus Poribacteria bacterium]|nr:hypothetical protein [Candidatus Poribacteria bacterium]